MNRVTDSLECKARRIAGFILLGVVLLVPFLVRAEIADTNWLSYNGTVDGQRFADVAEITAVNVALIDEVCRVKVADGGSFQSGLVQIDGVIYLTTATDTVAVDASTCSVKWRHQYSLEQKPVHQVNRGVAFSNGRIFRGTPDARLLAIDAASGRLLWKHQVGDPAQGEFLSAAPQVFQGLLIIGTAGGEWGVRGRIMAYDIDDGREQWRFNSVASDDEPGADSWGETVKSARSGGASWTSYTLDMSTGELFVALGNPARDHELERQAGQNRYTNSVVVLDAASGALKWHFQLPSNNAHDLDVAAAPVLYDNKDGEPMLAVGSKDGHVYAINRNSREQVFRTPITRIVDKSARLRKKGEVVCPGPFGGVAWNGPAFDRKNNQIVVGVVDWCATLKQESGDRFASGEYGFSDSWEFYDAGKGWVVGLDPDSGEPLWKYRTQGPQVAGVTPTAGNLTFSGDMVGYLYVLESSSGRELFRKHTGGAIAGGVITYLREARQYIAFTSGNESKLTFGGGGSSGKPNLVIYRLGGKTPPHPEVGTLAYKLANQPPDKVRGKALYQQHCASCHGSTGQGGASQSPRIRGIGKRMSMDRIESWIRKPSGDMPWLFPEHLNDKAVRDIAAHVHGL